MIDTFSHPPACVFSGMRNLSVRFSRGQIGVGLEHRIRDGLARFERGENFTAMLNGKFQPVSTDAGAVEIHNRIDTSPHCGGRDCLCTQARQTGASDLAVADEFSKAHPLPVRNGLRRGFNGAATCRWQRIEIDVERSVDDLPKRASLQCAERFQAGFGGRTHLNRQTPRSISARRATATALAAIIPNYAIRCHHNRICLRK